jgi:thiol-disulfide isomerase/thioredoxin
MTYSPGWFVRYCGFGLLLGGLGVPFLAGCGGSAPVTAQKSKFQVAGDDEKDSAKEGASEAGKEDKEDNGFPTAKAKPLQPKPGTKKAPASGGEPEAETPAKTAESPEVAEDATDYGASPQYPLPPGGPQKVFEFLKDLDQKQPKGSTKKEQEADFHALQDSKLAAARKLMTYKIRDEVKAGLLQMMMRIHVGFVADKIPGAQERMDAFVKELCSSKDSMVAEFGRMQEFDLAVRKLANQDPPPADGKEIVAVVEKYVSSAEGSPVPFLVAASRCEGLQEIEGATRQFQLDLVDELKKLAEKNKNSPVQEVASKAEEILKKSAVLVAQVAINALIKDAGVGKEGAEDQLVATLKTLLDKEKSPEAMQFAADKAHELEVQERKYPLALKLYELLAVAAKDHENKELAAFVAETVEAARKRLGLIGKPLVVEGVTLDGKPFDFAPYKGKYVLVDFWATWCPPCRAELPHVRKNFNAFHAKGFDVIGIALEEDISDLEQFLEFQKLPWTCVVSSELFEKKKVEDKMANPMAAANGVNALPFVVLLDKEGNVDSLHVRGPRLEARLKELLGEPAEEPAEEEKKSTEEKVAPAKEDKKPAENKPAAPKAEEPKKEEAGGGCGVVIEEEKKKGVEEEKVNPYSAKPGLSTDKLVAYIEKMLDKPKSIQSRPGFTEAVVDACDRVLTANPAAKESESLAAAEAKFAALHKKACTGDDACDKALVAFTDQMKADTRERIARQVAFFLMERKVLDGAELPAEKIPALLKELKDYYAAEKLTTKHLRMASSTVALINKLESGDEREKLFAEFGGLFVKASDKELARYGKKLAQKPETEESDLVGKDLELAGTTAAGNPFKWGDYRGKVVLVDFWATWCGPCKREMPHVKELHEKLTSKGFTVVGVSLDKDQEALQAYLAENQIPWENLAGDETQELAEKYGVRGIPTMMAIGKDGKILGVSHNVASLVPLIEKALAAK